VYSLSQLRTAVETPALFLRELNRLYHRRLYSRSYNTGGLDLFDADWDNLLVLDACRFDAFARRHDLPGTLEARTSRAASTREWLHANFAGRDLRDTIYVTASPMLYRNREAVDATFHEVSEVWMERGWNDEFRTVLPETLTAEARAAAESHPEKRLLVHYIQPHYPFIGPTGRELFDLDRLDFRWNDALTGDLDVDPGEIRTAYRENLDVVLPYVEELLTALGGKTVVTSDHGQMLGERCVPVPIRDYGHPPGIYSEGLVRVPWLEYENGPRREITVGEERATGGAADEDVVADRLEQLGYVT